MRRGGRLGDQAFFMLDTEVNRHEFWSESRVNEEAGIPVHV